MFDSIEAIILIRTFFEIIVYILVYGLVGFLARMYGSKEANVLTEKFLKWFV